MWRKASTKTEWELAQAHQTEPNAIGSSVSTQRARTYEDILGLPASSITSS